MRPLDFDEKPGIDPREARDTDVRQCCAIIQIAQELARRGTVTPDIAEDVERYVTGHLLREHVAHDQEMYRKMVADGSFDKAREYAAGYTRGDESPDGVLVRHRAALTQVLAKAADTDVNSGHMHPADYQRLMSLTDEGSTSAMRERLSLNRPAPVDDDEPIDLDAEPPLRDLTNDERTRLGTALFMDRYGVPVEAAPPPKKSAPREEKEAHAGDWSPRKMAAWVERRDAEEVGAYSEREAPSRRREESEEEQPSHPMAMDSISFEPGSYDPQTDQ